MTIRVEMHGEYPSYIEKCFGTTAEILAHVPTVRMAEGFSTDGGGQGTWVAGNGTWVGFTNAHGSPSAPFASTAERDAIMPAGVPRRECYMLNEFAPLAPGVPGLVKWIDTGTTWVLASDQVLVNIANADGSAIFDETTALRTPGTAYDLWTSDILPKWLLTDGFRGAAAMDAGLTDAASVALVTMRLTIGDGLQTGTDANNGLLGFTSAAAPSSKGFAMTPANFRVQGGAVFAVAGGAPFLQAQNNPRDQFQTINNPRLRLNAVVGATTNRYRIWSVTLKSGVC